MYPILATLLAVTAVMAQDTTNSSSQYTCPSANGNFCAGTSQQTNIIIYCVDGVGTPANCNNNIAGVPPVGVYASPCYQTNETAGDAACSKNCTVYPDSGSSFTIPADSCDNSLFLASYNADQAAAAALGNQTTDTGNYTVLRTSGIPVPYPTNGTYVVTTCLQNTCQAIATTVVTGAATAAATNAGGVVAPAPAQGASATATPVRPTASTVVTAGAAINSVGGLLAILGFYAAYMM